MDLLQPCFIFETDNKASLKAAIEKIYNNIELNEEMKAYCLSHQVTDTLEEYTEKTENIYRELIK